MSNRVRNLSILGAVAALLVLALLVILPGTPLSKDTKLGLDLEGGIELVYEARPTPQVPEVTQQAIDDAIETMRKRVDSLGVAEPEIQRSGREQIAVGLPSVQNAERAKAQVGTTARLQFYDWEPNLLTDREIYAGGNALYEATAAASKEEGRAEKVDIVPGSGDTPEEADKNNNTASDRYYLFGPDQLPIGPDKLPVRTGSYDPSGSCKELLAEYQEAPGAAKEYAKDTECLSELEALGGGGPPSGSRVIKVPEGVVVIEQERSPNQPPQIKRFTVLEDDSELSGEDIKNPEANTDPNTNAPLVSMKFSDKGREAFARVTKRIAERGFNASTLQAGGDKDQFNQRFAITLDDQIVSLATIDFTELPEGIDGRDGAQIENVGTFQDANDLAESLRIGALPIDLKLISETQVSATLGKQALDQGLLAGAVGLALTIVFLLFFYRVLGMVATAALLIYALLLFALVKLIPITLTLPGIAGLVLTLAVAADANIVMYERIKEEVRAGRSIPAAISAGYAKALRTIIDANVVTVGVAFILFTLATAGVKGFAFTLGIGTLVSLFTAVLATSAILGSMARSRLLRRPSALGVGKDHKSWSFDFMGNVALVLLVLGRDPAGRRDLDRDARHQLRDRLRVGNADRDPAGAPGDRGRRARRARAARLRRREDPAGRRSGARRERLPALGAAARSQPGRRGRGRPGRGLRRGGRPVLIAIHRSDLRAADRPDRAARGDRVAAPDLALHRLPLRVEVRRPDPDRARPRPLDHRGRVRPDREGGHDLDGRRPAHDHGLLAL